MVERYRRGKGKQKLLGSHQRCWIWGRNAVLETLRAGRWPLLELRLADRLPDDEIVEAQVLAAATDTPAFVESAEELSRRCRSAEHQGYAAKLPPFPYDDSERLLADRPNRPLYLLLDSIQDPYNFGAILRSAEVLGVDAVFIGEKNQVGVTSLVARTSAGAVNHVRLARVPDLPAWAERMHDASLELVAATQHADVPVFAHDFSGPTALVLGNEAAGIHEDLLKQCQHQVRIPQSGRVASLNAAVAAGILLYEVHRQRHR